MTRSIAGQQGDCGCSGLPPPSVGRPCQERGGARAAYQGLQSDCRRRPSDDLGVAPSRTRTSVVGRLRGLPLGTLFISRIRVDVFPF